MSSNFKKRISDISEKLQQQYDDKARVTTKNQELKVELSNFFEQFKKMEKKFNKDMENKQEELETLQKQIKEKIDKKLHLLMESFNQEKKKYEELSKQESEINN